MFLALKYKHGAWSQMCFHLCFLYYLLCSIHGKYGSGIQEHSEETSFWRPRPATDAVQTSAILSLARPISLLNVSIGNIGFCVNVDYTHYYRETRSSLVALSSRALGDLTHSYCLAIKYKNRTGNDEICTLHSCVINESFHGLCLSWHRCPPWPHRPLVHEENPIRDENEEEKGPERWKALSRDYYHADINPVTPF